MRQNGKIISLAYIRADQCHFTRIFKKYVGLSPRNTGKNQQKNKFLFQQLPNVKQPFLSDQAQP